MENKKISSQYPSRSYGNRQQPEKKVKKAEGQNIFARSGRAVKKKFRIFSIRAGMDMPFFLLIMVILCIGLVMLFSASYANAYYVYGDSYYFIKDQALFAVLGIVIMILVSYFDYHHLHKFAMPVLGVSFLLLVVVLFQPAINQVHRWVQIGTFSFQASEVTKFAIVLSFAHLISINFKRMDTFRYGILPYLIILVPTLLLLAAEPHISCIAIVVLLAAGMLFIGGVKLRWFVIALSVIVGAILYLVIFTDNFSYANDRILGWLDPFNEQIWQETWQTRNSLYAIGSGGLLGLIGALIIIILFALLVWRGISISLKAKDKFGSLLGIGLSAQVGLQVILNIAVVTNTIPNTGISLPFFSYGGTSLVILLAQMGVVLSISRTSMIEKG